ncbi:glycosyltransferase 87 family protein [Nocardioides scoriae]|uniref:glycosyltransferase 87 family protein n=1 Tax=Nocardioides scoriae TaxID=642780 RepID=UPI001E3424CE|nr:glycosyltransferase 87 family protein [Nocardioides scoriae]
MAALTDRSSSSGASSRAPGGDRGDRVRSMLPRLLPWLGLAVAVGLVAWSFWYPGHSGEEVYSRAPRSASDRAVPPLHGLWEPKWFGPGTAPAVLLALLSWRYAAGLAERLPWRRLLVVGYAAGLAWMLSLALVDGTAGLSRQLGNPYEYLTTARDVGGLGTLFSTWLERMPLDSPDAFPTHVAGHPPAALLFFVALVKVGLGGDLAAGVVVTLLAATTALAVLVTLRALGAEATARRAAPFLVVAPTAVFMAVSGDAVFAAVAAWGIACLALGTAALARASTPKAHDRKQRRDRRRGVGWSLLAGLLLGMLVMMSYGMPLMGLLAVAVLVAGRSWRPLPLAAGAALVVVLGFAAAGWAWWDFYPALVERYEEGIAKDRPEDYWRWANLALLVISAGPLVAAGVAHLAARPRAWLRRDHAPLLLAGAAVVMVAAADASGMSKAEVERIWLPFMPWLLVSCALLPERWRRWGLGLQLLTALVVQQLFYTVW